jgi:hypothetical protein
MFTLLFSNAVVLREIYNGIYGTSYGKETPVKINTLSDVLFKNRKNDISFLIDNKLIVLLEHQSTINPNMPLRFLIYIARLYESIIDDEALYRTKLLKVPFPEFIVFYNGPAYMAEKTTLRLSDAFQALGIHINLELEVTVYNINAGCNAKLAASSATLRDYMTFVAQVREYEKTLPLTEAVKEAINYCIKRNVLAKFLKKHGSEVRNMLVEEYNVDTAVRVAKEEGIEIDEARSGKEGSLQVLSLLERGDIMRQIQQQLDLDALLLDERRRTRFGAKAQNVLLRKRWGNTELRVAEATARAEGQAAGLGAGEAQGEEKVLEQLEQGYSVEQIEQRLSLNALLLDKKRRPRHGAKARNMLTGECYVDRALRAAREKGLKEGLEVGVVRGKKKVMELLTQGCSVGQIKQQLDINAL